MSTPTVTTPRLWEIDHPFYAAEGHQNELGSFAELKAYIDAMDEDMNFVYRWDWYDAAAKHNDGLFSEGEVRDEQHLTVTTVMQRKSRFATFQCPIRHDQEAEVLEWLHGDRIAGSLRRTWAPILDTNDAGPMLELANVRGDIDYWRGRALTAEHHVERLTTRAAANQDPESGERGGA